jgi:hypothetical protein
VEVKAIKNKPFQLSSLVFITCAILIFSVNAQSALAHQRGLFTIGGKQYLLVVGSMNEPVFVDAKSGVDFFAYMPNPKNPMDSHANGTKSVTGLDKTLKVIVSAGNKSRTFALEPVFREPGHYNAVFYPTAQTTYSYTLNGTINNTPTNIKWTCIVGPESMSMNNSTVKISDGVIRDKLIGSFSCPASRTPVSFPGPYISNTDIQNKLSQLENKLSQLENKTTVR